MPVSGGPRICIRPPLDSYLVPGTGWMVTIGTKDPMPAFADLAQGLAVADVFRARSATRGAPRCFSLMPDHAHVLVQITSDGAGLVDLIGHLTSCRSRIWWAHGHRGQMWRRRFHDQGLRTPADCDRAATYLLNNPVRAGSVNAWWGRSADR